MTFWALLFSTLLAMQGPAASEREQSQAPPLNAIGGIRIKGSKAYQRQVVKALQRIRRTSVGSRLLGELKRAGATVTVRFGVQDFAGGYTSATGGGDSVILWNPDYRLDRYPAFLVLYHELVHSLHEAQADRTDSEEEEEQRTIGLKKYADYPLSENALRRELKLPLRHDVGREDLFTSTAAARAGR